MGRLFLVRHGQTCFQKRNYDKLSETGETQARLLGEYWAQRRVTYDQVYAGPRARHVDTAEIVGKAYQRAGLAWPEPTVLEEFDEYLADSVLEQGLPLLLKKDDQVRQLHRAFKDSKSIPEQMKNFQRMFQIVVGQWVEGRLPLSGVERWSTFCARVRRGISQITADGRSGRQVVVFSSGGPVGAAMQHALGISPQATLQVVWMVRNGSFTEFLFSGHRFTLSTFNSFPHLDDPSLLTYR